MFTEGQKVYSKAHEVTGTVTYSDDSVVYIETRSGVEMEFKPSDLVDYEAQVKESNTNKAFDKIAEYLSVLMPYAELCHKHAQKILREVGGDAAPFNELTSEQKLNYLAIFFNVDRKIFLEYYESDNGSLARLALFLHARLGDAMKES